MPCKKTAEYLVCLLRSFGTRHARSRRWVGFAIGLIIVDDSLVW
ncbi:hypothetical protein [Moritella sp. 24]|nr:hypothetical protein [Moritella sp. 24]